MPPNKTFSSEDVDFSFVAALEHPLSKSVENRAVSIIGMKLLIVYTDHVHPLILYYYSLSLPSKLLQYLQIVQYIDLA
jgi:hypothetical protein